MQTEKFDVVVYHRNCLDGFAALLVAYIGGVLQPGNKLWFHACGADEGQPPRLTSQKSVLILDVHMNLGFVEAALRQAKRVVMVDHHHNRDHNELIRLANSSDGKFTYTFDKSECAASLTWKWLFPGKALPRFFEFIKDNDLATWSKPDTQLFVFGLEAKYNTHKGLTREATYEKLEQWKQVMSSDETIDKLIKIGRPIKAFQNNMLEKMEINSETVEISGPGGRKVRVVLSNAGVYVARKLSVRLVKKFKDTADIAIVWYVNVSKKMIECVVRSNEMDISWLLHMYGAAGHQRAGTFNYPALQIYEWLVQHENNMKKQLGGGGDIACEGHECGAC